MPTSATGRNKQQGAESGFTLIELLIVLVVIGLLSATVIIAMPDPRGSVTAEAERFAARTRAAQDQAIISGRAIAVRVTETGYSFEQRQEGEWQPIVSHAWTEGTRAGTQGRFLLDPTGLSEPGAVTLVRDDARATVEMDGGGAIRVRV
jgi:general secretion pathway protein H